VVTDFDLALWFAYIRFMRHLNKIAVLGVLATIFASSSFACGLHDSDMWALMPARVLGMLTIPPEDSEQERAAKTKPSFPNAAQPAAKVAQALIRERDAATKSNNQKSSKAVAAALEK